MKDRSEAVKFIQSQMLESETQCSRDKSGWHYGRQELRELLDFIYEGEPMNESEQLINDDGYRKDKDLI